MSETIQIDVRMGVTIITLPNGQRERIFHNDPRALQVTVDPVMPDTDHPEAEKPDKAWVPLVRAVPMKDGKQIEIPNTEVWKNDLYTVHKTLARWPGEGTGGIKPPFLVHLSIRRNDRHWARDWRHFQQIKNELVGPECEGVELYPAESRLVDNANQYHLWVLEEPGERWPVGWEDGRLVSSTDLVGLGSRQRQLPDGVPETLGPDDAKRMVVAYLASHNMPIPEGLS